VILLPQIFPYTLIILLREQKKYNKIFIKVHIFHVLQCMIIQKNSPRHHLLRRRLFLLFPVISLIRYEKH